MSNHKKKSESCRVQKSVQKIQGYDHESREAAAASVRRRAASAGSRGERRPPQHKFFLPCLRFLCTQEFGGHFFFAFAHFLLYTKDPDLLQALDLPVMPASAAQRAKFPEKVHKPLLWVNVIDFELNGLDALIWVL